MNITKEKIIDIVKQIPTAAEKEKWVFTLDNDENVLFYAPATTPDKTELFQVTDEYALYLDNKFNPRGVMIEYYGINFIKHHPEFGKITKKIFKKVKKKKIGIVNPRNRKNSEITIFKSLLEKTLLSDAVQEPLVSLSK